MLVFAEGGKPEQNPPNKVRKIKTYIVLWHQAGIEPELHWWEISTLTIVPSLCPNDLNHEFYYYKAALVQRCFGSVTWTINRRTQWYWHIKISVSLLQSFKDEEWLCFTERIPPLWKEKNRNWYKNTSYLWHSRVYPYSSIKVFLGSS